MFYYQNPDERIRAAERQFASTGDLEIAAVLFGHRQRSGLLSSSDIELLAVLGFAPAQEAYASLGRATRPKWNAKSLWQEQGQYRGFRLALAALSYTLDKCVDPKVSTDVASALQFLQAATPETYTSLRTGPAAKVFKKITTRLKELESAILKKGIEKRSWGRGWEIPEGTKISSKMLEQQAALSNLLEIRNMLAPAKEATFYKVGNAIMDNAILVAARITKLPEKQAMAVLYDTVILPEALRLILLTPSFAPSALSRDEAYYMNEIKSGRFTNASVHDSDCPMPRRVKQLLPEDSYFSFIVWTSSKKEAVAKIERLLYNLYGYIPDYHFYTRGYKSSAESDVKSGMHEDVLLPENAVEVPIDVMRLYDPVPAYRRGEARNQELTRLEKYICKNIAKLRPDLY